MSSPSRDSESTYAICAVSAAAAAYEIDVRLRMGAGSGRVGCAGLRRPRGQAAGDIQERVREIRVFRLDNCWKLVSQRPLQPAAEHCEVSRRQTFLNLPCK